MQKPAWMMMREIEYLGQVRTSSTATDDKLHVDEEFSAWT